MSTWLSSVFVGHLRTSACAMRARPGARVTPHRVANAPSLEGVTLDELAAAVEDEGGWGNSLFCPLIPWVMALSMFPPCPLTEAEAGGLRTARPPDVRAKRATRAVGRKSAMALPITLEWRPHQSRPRHRSWVSGSRPAAHRCCAPADRPGFLRKRDNERLAVLPTSSAVRLGVVTIGNPTACTTGHKKVIATCGACLTTGVDAVAITPIQVHKPEVGLQLISPLRDRLSTRWRRFSLTGRHSSPITTRAQPEPDEFA